jgi:peroxiredoxin family protein
MAQEFNKRNKEVRMSSKKLSIIVFSGDFDRAVAAFTLATGAAAVNWDVTLFFTFWGLNLIKKKQGRSFIGKGGTCPIL